MKRATPPGLASLLLLTACGGGKSPGESVARDAGAPDARASEAGMACRAPSACDGGHATEADGSMCASCPRFPPVDEAAPVGLSFEMPASVPPEVAFPVVVRTQNAWSGTVTVSDGARETGVRVYRGKGSASWTAPATAGVLELDASFGAARTTASLRVESRPTRTLTGVLQSADLTWSAAEDVRIEGMAEVVAGARLEIGPGVRVALAAGASLEVKGALVASGTAAAPILFHRTSGGPFSELGFSAGSEGELSHVFITGGGGDATRAFGHSNSEPVLRVSSANLSLQHAVIADNPGKALGTSSARVTLSDTLITRCDTGGEHERTLLHMRRTHTLEIPDADGQADDDDNDGIYLLSALLEGDEELVSTLEDVVFARGEDDAIDHNDARVRVERLWIEDFAHEGIAASAGRGIEVRDAVIQGCEQGIEAGYGSPEVVVERAYVHHNGVGLRVGDSYEREVTGSITARSSVIADNEVDLRNYGNREQGPIEGALTLSCSWVGAGEAPGSCNAMGMPESACAVAAPGCACEPPTLFACE